MKLVEVTWLDACSRLTDGRWSQMDDLRELTPVQAKSAGYLVKDEPTHIVIAAHLAAEMAGGDICIPRSCILSITSMKTTE